MAEAEQKKDFPVFGNGYFEVTSVSKTVDRSQPPKMSRPESTPDHEQNVEMADEWGGLLRANLRTENDAPIIIGPSILRRDADVLVVDARTSRWKHSHGVRLDRYQLTPREGAILRLVMQGKSNAEIARELAAAETTVKSYVGRILQKMSVSSRVELVQKVLEVEA